MPVTTRYFDPPSQAQRTASIFLLIPAKVVSISLYLLYALLAYLIIRNIVAQRKKQERLEAQHEFERSIGFNVRDRGGDRVVNNLIYEEAGEWLGYSFDHTRFRYFGGQWLGHPADRSWV
jgi:hypothetical protein